MLEFIAVMMNALAELDITAPGVCLMIYILQKNLTPQNELIANDFNATTVMY